MTAININCSKYYIKSNFGTLFGSFLGLCSLSIYRFWDFVNNYGFNWNLEKTHRQPLFYEKKYILLLGIPWLNHMQKQCYKTLKRF